MSKGLRIAAASALAGAVAGAAGFAVLRRRRRASRDSLQERERLGALAVRNGSVDRVEEASLESFPASDPPEGGGPGLR